MKFTKLDDTEILHPRSETARYRHLTAPFCHVAGDTPGVGVDIASQGDSVVPWAIGFDLPADEFAAYCGGEQPKGPIQLRGRADKLPFENESLDFVYSSHLLEDYLDWEPVLTEWVRVLRPNGYLIILVPDKELWGAAISAGQTPNCSHKHESRPGELSEYAEKLKLNVIEDRLTNAFPGDYSVLFVGRKTS